MKSEIKTIALVLAILFIFISGFAVGSSRSINVKVNGNIEVTDNVGSASVNTNTTAVINTTAAPITTTAAPVTTTAPANTSGTQQSSTAAPSTATTTTQAPTTSAPATQAPKVDLNKKGDLFKASCDKKIWAGILGECYLVLRNIDEGNEWGETGKVYELHVTYVKTGEEYGMWSDGYWEMSEDGTELTLTPKNQSENGNIGVEAGQSKTFTAVNGVFEIPITFEQGGNTTIYLDIEKNAL